MIEINETKPVEASLVIRLTGDDVRCFKEALYYIVHGIPLDGQDDDIAYKIWMEIR